MTNKQKVKLKCKLCGKTFTGIPEEASDPYEKLSDHLLTDDQDKVFEVVEVTAA